jgi:hypothetical protein
MGWSRVLRTDDRLLFSEALAPPDGYELDVLAGTTYSLHLTALLAVPLALTFVDWEDDAGRPSADPVAALEAVRRHAARITVFAQAGEIGAGGQPPLVASWLEDVVTPVAAPSDEGVFHPKVWVARYRERAGGVPHFRMICASRNLTFDRSWDTALVLDGRPTARGGRCADTEPLADFIAALPALAVTAMPAHRADAIAELAESLRRVRFGVPAGFERLRFIPLGLGGRRVRPFDRRISRLLVMSPFIGERQLATFAPELSTSLLVSRPEELETIATARLRSFERVCAIDDAGATDEATADDGCLTGLHAKLYVADAGWESTVWTGSANATRAAFESNVEFLVELGGRRSECGVDRFLGNPDDPTSLAALLVDVPRREEPVPPDVRAAMERELDAIARDVAERSFTAGVAAADGGYSVELRANPALRLDGPVMRCWPLTESPDRYPDASEPSGEVVARFSPLPLEHITAFYAIELALDRDGVQVRKAFLVRAALLGAPETRREAIIRRLLQDPDQVLRLLRLLLAFDPDGDAGGAGTLLGLETGGAWLQGETPLLEALLRALHESPERLSSIASLVDDLAAAGADVLPPGFSEIWDPIRRVHERNEGRA